MHISLSTHPAGLLALALVMTCSAATAKTVCAQTGSETSTGPWATTGTTPLVQTDYAVFDDSARVLPANIAATTGSTEGVTVTKDIPTAGLDTVTLSVTQGLDPKKFARLKVVIAP